MLPLPPVFSPNALSASLLNALLRREPWAADRLSRHAGKSLRFHIGPVQAAYTIESTGLLRVCDAAVTPDVSLTIGSEHLASLPAVLRSRDLNAITEKLHVQGDAALATLVSELARDLRFDVEDELAGRFGDILGPGLLKGGQVVVGGAQKAVNRATANLAEYLGEEGQLLATRPAMEAFTAGCSELHRRLAELERRLNRHETSHRKGA